MKSKAVRILLTSAVVAIAVIAVLIKYRHYLGNPWTRDGMVRAQVIQMTPRVTGPIINLPIVDNQFVKKGEELFAIDPRTFQANLDQSLANLDNTRDNIESLAKQVEAAKASVAEYDSRIKQAKSTIKAYMANEEDARITLRRMEQASKTGGVSGKDVDDARAASNIAISQVEKAEEALIEAHAALVQAQAELARDRAGLGAEGEENAQLRAAQAAVEQAQLDLEFTKVVAPVDGYVTNLNLRLGSQTVTNQPALALVDIDSYWVHGFFKEDIVGDIEAGDEAVVTLMSYPDTPLKGRVDSIGWGIAQSDGSTGEDLLPNVAPTFEWIRLAQRIPVRVHIENVPENVKLRVGTTASVLVIKGTGGNADNTPPTPKVLQ
jgi:multidrug resistance efflux pump